MKKILLAYSGGLDTSCILVWLKENYDVPVVAYCADVGQKEDFEAVKQKALALGADKCIVGDLKHDFVQNFVFPAIKANAVYESVYLMGTALARPCIASGMITAALREGCDTIAHGATGKGNDQVRFELAIKALAPDLAVVAPWRIWQFNSREDLFNYAERKSIPVPVSRSKPYSIDENLMHISYEGGVLEDAWSEAPEDLYQWTVDPVMAPCDAQYVEVDYQQGTPAGINGIAMNPVELLQNMNAIAAAHGVGRVDCVENRYIGIKSRGVYETPGTTVLMQAHKAIESITLDRQVMHLKDSLAQQLSVLIYNGYWFAPECRLLVKLMEETQAPVNGTAKVKLYKGLCSVVGRKSATSLYDRNASSFENMSSFSPADAGGFININGLRLTAWSKKNADFEKTFQRNRLIPSSQILFAA